MFTKGKSSRLRKSSKRRKPKQNYFVYGMRFFVNCIALSKLVIYAFTFRYIQSSRQGIF